MTKEELKPIDVSKYKVTETGQVLKMTKEELEKEARDYALEWGDKTDGTYACCRDGYLAGAEPREKRIAELEAQIEKMKCCYNCSKWNEGLLLCNDSTVRVTTYADYCCEDWEG